MAQIRAQIAEYGLAFAWQLVAEAQAAEDEKLEDELIAIIAEMG